MKNINTSDCSLKCEINGVLYNYRVVKCDKKANTGVVELAKVGGKKPKYATIDYVDAKFDGLNKKVNDLTQELLTKLDNLQKWTDKKISIAFIKIAEKFDELVRKVG